MNISVADDPDECWAFLKKTVLCISETVVQFTEGFDLLVKHLKLVRINSKNVGTLPLTVQKISQNKAANFKSWNWRCVCVYTLKCIFDFYNILKIDLLNIPDRNFFKIEFKKFLIKSLVVLTRNHPAHNQKNY